MKFYLLYFSLVSSYFLANLIRVSPGVVMPQLAASLGMNAAVVGLISSLYFYAYLLSAKTS